MTSARLQGLTQDLHLTGMFVYRPFQRELTVIHRGPVLNGASSALRIICTRTNSLKHGLLFSSKHIRSLIELARF